MNSVPIDTPALRESLKAHYAQSGMAIADHELGDAVLALSQFAELCLRVARRRKKAARRK